MPEYIETITPSGAVVREIVSMPEQPRVPEIDPCQHLIDIGPFFDRFGAFKMAVLTSADVVVRAIVQDVTVRKWVDLQRADVAQALDLLVSKSLLDATTKTAILTNPVTIEENRALRKQFF